MGKKSVGMFVGSLRNQSFSKKAADYVASLLSGNFDIHFPDINRLCIYNQDLDEDPPQEWKLFREEVRALDAVLFVTPEYNRSIPPVLKNAIDIASRPQGENAWNGKRGAVITVSPGAVGGFGANHHLRQVAVCVNILMLAQPEMYVGNAAGLFADDGSLTDERAKGLFENFAAAYTDWVTPNRA